MWAGWILTAALEIASVAIFLVISIRQKTPWPLGGYNVPKQQNGPAGQVTLDLCAPHCLNTSVWSSANPTGLSGFLSEAGVSSPQLPPWDSDDHFLTAQFHGGDGEAGSQRG